MNDTLGCIAVVVILITGGVAGGGGRIMGVGRWAVVVGVAGGGCGNTAGRGRSVNDEFCPDVDETPGWFVSGSCVGSDAAVVVVWISDTDLGGVGIGNKAPGCRDS